MHDIMSIKIHDPVTDLFNARREDQTQGLKININATVSTSMGLKDNVVRNEFKDFVKMLKAKGFPEEILNNMALEIAARYSGAGSSYKEVRISLVLADKSLADGLQHEVNRFMEQFVPQLYIGYTDGFD